jgi:hypothetical protein
MGMFQHLLFSFKGKRLKPTGWFRIGTRQDLTFLGVSSTGFQGHYSTRLMFFGEQRGNARLAVG